MTAVLVERKPEVVGVLRVLRIHRYGLAQVLERSWRIVQLQKIRAEQRVIVGSSSLRRLHRLKRLDTLLKLFQPKISECQIEGQTAISGIEPLSLLQLLYTLASATGLEVKQPQLVESGHLFGILLQDLEELLLGSGKILIAQVSRSPLVVLAKSSRRLGGCPLGDDELEKN